MNRQFKIRRRKVRGLSLLEIMIAIMVLTVSLVAFASVFPAAFKLNHYAGRYTQAEKFASAVIEELRKFELADHNTAKPGFIDYYDADESRLEELTSVKNLEKAGFRLKKNKKGPKNDDIISISGTFCTFTVNVYWDETSHGGLNSETSNCSVTVIGGRTGKRI